MPQEGHFHRVMRGIWYLQTRGLLQLSEGGDPGWDEMGWGEPGWGELGRGELSRGEPGWGEP